MRSVVLMVSMAFLVMACATNTVLSEALIVEAPTDAADPTPSRDHVPTLCERSTSGSGVSVVGPCEVEDWQTHSFASAVLPGHEIGDGWELNHVQIEEPNASSHQIEDGCGIEAVQNRHGGGISAQYFDEDGPAFVVESILREERRTVSIIDELRALAACGSIVGDGTVMELEEAPTTPVLSALDSIALQLRFADPDGSRESTALAVHAHYEGAYISVQATHLGSGALPLDLEQIARLVETAAQRLTIPED